MLEAEGRRLYPLTLADSEPKEESCHSLDWVMAGKANKVGGVKWVSSPMSRWMTGGLSLQHKMLPPTKMNIH